MKVLDWTKKIAARFSFKKANLSPVDLRQDPPMESPPWWGTFLIGEEQSQFFKIGNRVLCVDRYEQEWRITLRLEGASPFRSFAAKSSNQITLKPTLADRPFLCELEQPFYVPPKHHLSLYLSSPAWMTIEVGSPPILLDEVPNEELTDTWFGPNTLEGELCYATPHRCSAHLEEHLEHAMHVMTPIFIINRSRTPLFVQTLKIPLPSLSIYSDAARHLWTEQLQFTQADKEQGLGPPLIKGTPKTLKDLQLITPPRLNVQRSFMKTLLTLSNGSKKPWI